mmetsp:Transcript_10095/g.11591  ORF Transcript_10095/g.11591 Transcript_10095/m.11591 type:complete len:534 (+) Transcript_10095:412-2013(+)|eukprot:CAMPEP_0184016200 /NCGR_PEP_ID=MMETSP0954-20121128/6788_1 /TAXON_ID=627963 /ORGANISM="Aplanochytrium sp, Strain PBS07" /LENGTH=533 /DNA_ID=CAMNT_0026297177 /DNA_START=469 /DNA_END=2070 /DNA_ORIENTATION=+
MSFDGGEESDSGLASVKAISVNNGIFSNSFIATKNVAVQQGGAEAVNVKYLRKIRSEQADREKRLSKRRVESMMRIRELSLGPDSTFEETALRDALQKVVDFLRPIDHVRFFSILNEALDIKIRKPKSGEGITKTVLNFLGMTKDVPESSVLTAGGKDFELYLAIVSNRQSGIESAALLFFKQEKPKRVTSSSRRLRGPNNNPMSLVTFVPIVSDTRIRLRGGGLLRVFSNGNSIEIDTVSVRSLWGLLSALQQQRQHARDYNLYTPVTNHQWLKAYSGRAETSSTIDSEEIREEEENCDDNGDPNGRDLSDSSTTDSDYFGEDEDISRPSKSEIQKEIRNIILKYDPDELTTNHVLDGLKKRFGADVIGENGYSKSHIDKLTIRTFGQLDPPSEILPGLFLGTEYNASNLRELQGFGVKLIVNVTSEVENFFPSTFEYHTISLLDRPSSVLLDHFDAAIDKIENARKKNQAVLVHCQRGISRSASIVITFLMRTRNLSYEEAYELVKGRRSIIKPNKGFIEQMKTYESMLTG